MRESKEYNLYKAVATYLRLQYPKVIYRFDMAGVNLSKAAAGRNKAIQHSSGYPDLFIAEPKNRFHGLYIELKAEGTRLRKANGLPASEHIAEQMNRLSELQDRGYDCYLSAGFDNTKMIIDQYLKR